MLNQAPAISCAEFQENLPDFFASTKGVLDDPALKAHLATCENCSTLVRDLQYIAQSAHDIFKRSNDVAPSDNVWSNIQSRLKQESDESPG